MKKITDFIIYGNILISLCAAALIWETYLLWNIPVNFFCVFIGFAATLMIYNVDRLVVLDSIDQTGSERHEWIVKNRRLLTILSATGFGFVGVSIFHMPIRCLLFLAHLGLISILYSVPVLMKGARSLRSLKLLKIFLITYVWASTTVLLPAIWSEIGIFHKDIMLLFAERALFIFAITLPFDIRDYDSDKSNLVVTIPGLIGIRQTRLLAFGCLLVFFLINLVHYNFHDSVLWAKLLSGLNALLVIYFAHERKHEYYYTGLLDSTMIIQFVLVLVLR